MRSAPCAVFPDASLRDYTGRSVLLASLWASGPCLVLVGHRDCKTTRETLPHAERIHRRRGSGSSVVAVLQDDADTARTLAERLSLTLPVLLEGEPFPLARALGVEVVPTLFLVSPGGGIEQRSEGFRRSDLEAFAGRLGVAGSLFSGDEKVPTFRPG